MRWELVPFAVVLLAMAWRVWRLEDRVGRKGPSGPDWEHMIKVEGRINDTYGYARGVDRALGDLARALGYEWKRTDAKEGWEKKAGASPYEIDWNKRECTASAFEHVFRNIRYENLPGITADRRKADRRKPAPDIFVSKPCAKCDARAAKEAVESVERDINRPWTKADLKSVFGPGGKKPAKKKPRRAH